MDLKPIAAQHGYDDNAAMAEGWAIFDADGSVQNKDGRSPFQLQRIDEMEKFDGDIEAWRYVIDRAKEGSLLHLGALRFLAAESPGEIDQIAETYPDVRSVSQA